MRDALVKLVKLVEWSSWSSWYSVVVSILVTGGAGFVGSHVARVATDAGREVVVLDIAERALTLPPSVTAIRGDIADKALVAQIIERYGVDAIVHCAGLIAVGESVKKPAAYFETNVVKTLALLDVAVQFGLPVVFSSSAAVYATSDTPLVETARCAPLSPYGMTKFAVEHALAAYGAAYGLRWAALRYFNAAGAHPDGSLREAHEPETHLIPLAIDTARGTRPPLALFGADYATRDGTCIRDYVHVCDLADAHLKAVDATSNVGVLNLGSGRGYSVREVIDACGRVLGKPVQHEVAARRPGDAPVLVADIARAKSVLGWWPTRELDTIVEDAARSR